MGLPEGSRQTVWEPPGPFMGSRMKVTPLARVGGGGIEVFDADLDAVPAAGRWCADRRPTAGRRNSEAR